MVPLTSEKEKYQRCGRDFGPQILDSSFCYPSLVYQYSREILPSTNRLLQKIHFSRFAGMDHCTSRFIETLIYNINNVYSGGEITIKTNMPHPHANKISTMTVLYLFVFQACFSAGGKLDSSCWHSKNHGSSNTGKRLEYDIDECHTEWTHHWRNSRNITCQWF